MSPPPVGPILTEIGFLTSSSTPEKTMIEIASLIIELLYRKLIRGSLP
jgi:hypothetical protein